MIRSLFDTEDLPEEEKKRGGETVEDEPTAPVTAETSSNPQTQNKNTAADESGISRRSESQGVFVFDPDEDSILELEPSVAAESDQVFAKLETEAAKIEAELRTEKEAAAFSEDQPVAQQADSGRGETGAKTPVFSALDKTKKPAASQRESEKADDESEMAAVAGEPQISPSVPAGVLNEEDQTESVPKNTALSPVVAAPEFSLSEELPQSKAEIIRQSGLAWTAATILFGSIAFLLIIGWFVDLLLGTSPWGVVGGIVLGSIIGFFQFFRLTSQILKR